MAERKSVVSWLFDNALDIVMFAVLIVFVFWGTAKIVASGRTVVEILASGSVSLVVAFLVKTIMSKKGIQKGLVSDEFISTANTYGQELVGIAPFVEELEPFCEYINKERLKVEQSRFLLRHAMKYELFVNGEYDDVEDKQDILKQCRNVDIVQYTPMMITNAYADTENEKELLNYTIKGFERNQRLGDIFIGILMFVIFGYFTFEQGRFDVLGMLWGLGQVGIFLFFGMVKQMNSYYFVTRKLREKIKRIISIIDQFKNIRNKNEGIFEVKE